MSQEPTHSNLAKFLMGGTAGMMATCVVQPMDLIKNRMQLSGEGGAAKAHKNAFDAFKNILRSEGLSGLYNGLSAGLLRQATYTSTRLGVHQFLIERFGADTSFFAKAMMGMTAGGIGAVVGNPAEVALVRMTSDGRLPPAERRNYANSIVALGRIAKEEGVTTLWRGTQATVTRAMVLNAAQLGGYSHAKETLLRLGWFGDRADSVKLHAPASVLSAILCTIVSLPVDISKTRLQSMKPNAAGEFPYRNTLDVIRKTATTEGVHSLWKGFTPYFLRLAPHTVLTFVILEQMRNFF